MHARAGNDDPMPDRNLLVVLLDDVPESQLRRAAGSPGGDTANVHVVTPARVSKLQWLATDEDAARAEADIRALEAEWMLSDDADVEGEGGDVDPVQAVEDALRAFPANEIVIVGGNREDRGLEASLRDFGIPVRRLDGSPPLRRRDRLHEGARRITTGRSRATPFVFFAGVNLFLFLLAVLITVVVALVVWLI